MAGNSGEFRDKIVLNIGQIKGQIEVLQNNGERQARDFKDVEKRLSKAIRQVNERVDKHLKDHKDNPKIMGLIPMVNTYLKPHWRVVLLVIMLAQVLFAGLIMKFGIEKITKWIF